jgi:hypothetical protein
LQLDLCIAALYRHRVGDVLSVGEFAGQCKAGVCVLLGENAPPDPGRSETPT